MRNVSRSKSAPISRSTPFVAPPTSAPIGTRRAGNAPFPPSPFFGAPFFRVSLFFATFFLAAFVFLAGNAGCATFFDQIRPNAADRRFAVSSPLGPKRSQSATQTLKALGVPEKKVRVPELERLLAEIDAKPSPEAVYAYVESAYLEARRLETRRPALAVEIYATSALYAYHYLFNPTLQESRRSTMFDAQARDVAVLYNGSCERLLRLLLKDSSTPFRPGSVCRFEGESATLTAYCRVASGSWAPEEIESFELAADREVEELSFDCRRAGLGVPLVAKRRADAAVERPEEIYYPTGLQFPATAFLRPNPTAPLGSIPPLDPNADAAEIAEVDAELNGAVAILEIHDPLVSSFATVGDRAVPLECDLTTPLASYLASPKQLAFSKGQKGLLDPEKLLETIPTHSPTRERTLQGLYMLQPYDPAKIPVVMTHGLGSSPITWLEMYNSLRNVPEICDNYQFWFYFYPTGQPFWISAAQLRSDLRDLRETLDPEGDAPALDQTVLVGHSMGGLISRMQVAESGDRIWRRVSSVPLDDLDFDAETKANFRAWFFFEPNPSVRRVITIATPFRGSDYANGFTQWLADRAISIPKTVASAAGSLASLLETDASQIDDPTLLETATSVDSLSPKSPIFDALDECPIPKSVALNNIVGALPSLEKRWFAPKKSDGVVEFWSSNRDDVESQREIPAAHTTAHAHPAAIWETKEILLRHLAEARSKRPDVFADESESATASTLKADATDAELDAASQENADATDALAAENAENALELATDFSAVKNALNRNADEETALALETDARFDALPRPADVLAPKLAADDAETPAPPRRSIYGAPLN